MPEPATAVERVEKKGLDGRNINISYCVQTYSRSGNKLEILRDTCVNKGNVCMRATYLMTHFSRRRISW